MLRLELILAPVLLTLHAVVVYSHVSVKDHLVALDIQNRYFIKHGISHAYSLRRPPRTIIIQGLLSMTGACLLRKRHLISGSDFDQDSYLTMSSALAMSQWLYVTSSTLQPCNLEP